MLRGAARLLRVSAAGDAGAARSALESRGCAVVSVEQHREQGRFFERVVFDAGNGLDAGALEAALAPDAVTIRAADERPRLAVFAGKEPGCLEELLGGRGPASCAGVAGVLSNHATLAPLAADYGVPFHCFGGEDMEAAQLARLAELRVDVVALARYMQILGPAFCEAYAGRALNVHHSLLPAFPARGPTTRPGPAG
ncbi:phosphoribosylglycinamide formyltransferase [Aureococcus anophagefferens]|nr:phosphoribosylglycinamide formyltransferase [Aureococcus anophagefferens]